MKKLGILSMLALVSSVSGWSLTLTTGNSLTFTGTNGSNLSASAVFSLSATQLTIVLTNTGAAAANNPDLLQSLFWSSPTTFSLTGASALLHNGSTVQQNNADIATQPSGGNVGAKFDYIAGSDVTNKLSDYNQGLGGAGYDIFSINPDGGNMNGVNLTPDATNQDYGLVSSKGVANNGKSNENFRTKTAVIRSSVIFTFKKTANGGALPSSIDISKVRFQYGTSLTEPNFTGECTGICEPPNVVPEPSTYAALAVAVAGLVWRRKAQKKA